MGRLPYKHDDRHLLLSKYLSPSLPPPPAEVHWPSPHALGMLMNDRLGDCVVAGRLHAKMVQQLANGIPYFPSDNDALKEYEIVGGYDPSNPSTDQGCSMAAMMKYLAKIGEIGAYVLVDTNDHETIKQAIHLFGGMLVGWQLPKSLDDYSRIWQVPADLNGDNAPGSGGGHCTFIPGYDQNVLGNITWGQRIAATWAYHDAYIEEKWVWVSKYWCVNPAKAPNGIDMETLLADLQAVTS